MIVSVRVRVNIGNCKMKNVTFQYIHNTNG